MTNYEANKLAGRVLSGPDGMAYTVTSASTYGEVCVWDPRKQQLMRFDSRETFDNWVLGKPVPSAGPGMERKNK